MVRAGGDVGAVREPLFASEDELDNGSNDEGSESPDVKRVTRAEDVEFVFTETPATDPPPLFCPNNPVSLA